MKLSISETAKLVGVSVRTLRYYDEIGLLKPCMKAESGYRFYDDEALSKLSQIIFFKELEFSLSEISDIFTSPNYDVDKALKNHRELLLIKRKHIDELLLITEKKLGGQNMKMEITNNEVLAAKEKYRNEVIERWGKTDAFKESEKRDYSDNESAEITEKANEIFSLFSKNSDKSPNSPEVIALVKLWQEHITKYHYCCTKEILSCLGQMYSSDERFKANIDRFGDGTADFMSKAIEAYCKQ